MLHLDFETYSASELKKTGAFLYAQHRSTEVLIACFAFDDGEEVHTWLPRSMGYKCAQFHKFKNYVESGGLIIAHNAEFEFVILKYVLKFKVKPSQMVCTAARAAYCGLPRSLDGVTLALDLPHKKNVEGSKLIGVFCKPHKPTKKDPRTRIFPEDEPEKFQRFITYCQDDVRAEQNVEQVLPPLDEYEQNVFCFNIEMNDRGFPFDLEITRKAKHILSALTGRLNRRVTALTNGIRPTQRDKLMEFFNSLGADLENLQADSLRKKLAAGAFEPHVAKLIELRMEGAKASIKKLEAILTVAGIGGRARGMFLYYGAGTGRWCIEEDTMVLVRDEHGFTRKRKIQFVRSTDMLWDGVEWVSHSGVVASGEKEIIEHSGVRGSADHEVWVSPNKKVRLEDAKKSKLKIWKSIPWCTYELVFPNGHKYIGISTRPQRRFADHTIRTASPTIRGAIDAHGMPVMNVLNWYGSYEEAAAEEIRLIALTKSRYNRTAGGDAGPGFSSEVQRMASAKGAARLAELRKDPAYAKEHDRKVREGILRSTAFKEANRMKAQAAKGKPTKNPDGQLKAALAGSKARQESLAILREQGAFKYQAKARMPPVTREEKNRRVAAGVKKYFATKTAKERKEITAKARKAIVWDDARRAQQAEICSGAIRTYWEKKRET